MIQSYESQQLAAAELAESLRAREDTRRVTALVDADAARQLASSLGSAASGDLQAVISDQGKQLALNERERRDAELAAVLSAVAASTGLEADLAMAMKRSLEDEEKRVARSAAAAAAAGGGRGAELAADAAAGAGAGAVGAAYSGGANRASSGLSEPFGACTLGPVTEAVSAALFLTLEKGDTRGLAVLLAGDVLLGIPRVLESDTFVVVNTVRGLVEEAKGHMHNGVAVLMTCEATIKSKPWKWSSNLLEDWFFYGNPSIDINSSGFKEFIRGCKGRLSVSVVLSPEWFNEASRTLPESVMTELDEALLRLAMLDGKRKEPLPDHVIIRLEAPAGTGRARLAEIGNTPLKSRVSGPGRGVVVPFRWVRRGSADSSWMHAKIFPATTPRALAFATSSDRQRGISCLGLTHRELSTPAAASASHFLNEMSALSGLTRSEDGTLVYQGHSSARYLTLSNAAPALDTSLHSPALYELPRDAVVPIILGARVGPGLAEHFADIRKARGKANAVRKTVASLLRSVGALHAQNVALVNCRPESFAVANANSSPSVRIVDADGATRAGQPRTGSLDLFAPPEAFAAAASIASSFPSSADPTSYSGPVATFLGDSWAIGVTLLFVCSQRAQAVLTEKRSQMISGAAAAAASAADDDAAPRWERVVECLSNPFVVTEVEGLAPNLISLIRALLAENPVDRITLGKAAAHPALSATLHASETELRCYATAVSRCKSHLPLLFTVEGHGDLSLKVLRVRMHCDGIWALALAGAPPSVIFDCPTERDHPGFQLVVPNSNSGMADIAPGFAAGLNAIRLASSFVNDLPALPDQSGAPRLAALLDSPTAAESALVRTFAEAPKDESVATADRYLRAVLGDGNLPAPASAAESKGGQEADGFSAQVDALDRLASFLLRETKDNEPQKGGAWDGVTDAGTGGLYILRFRDDFNIPRPLFMCKRRALAALRDYPSIFTADTHFLNRLGLPARGDGAPSSTDHGGDNFRPPHPGNDQGASTSTNNKGGGTVLHSQSGTSSQSKPGTAQEQRAGPVTLDHTSEHCRTIDKEGFGVKNPWSTVSLPVTDAKRNLVVIGGRTIAGRLAVFDVEAGAVVAMLVPAAKPVPGPPKGGVTTRALAISLDRRMLISGCSHGHVLGWDLADLHIALRASEGPDAGGHPGAVDVSGLPSVESRLEVTTLNSEPVFAVVALRYGRFAAITALNDLCVWSREGELLATCQVPPHRMKSVAANAGAGLSLANGNLLTATSTVTVWSRATEGQLIAGVPAKDGQYIAGVPGYLPDNCSALDVAEVVSDGSEDNAESNVVVLAQTGKIVIFSRATPKAEPAARILQMSPDFARSMLLLPAGIIAYGDKIGVIRVRTLDGELLTIVRGHPGQVLSLAVAPNGWLVAVSEGQSSLLCDLRSASSRVPSRAVFARPRQVAAPAAAAASQAPVVAAAAAGAAYPQIAVGQLQLGASPSANSAVEGAMSSPALSGGAASSATSPPLLQESKSVESCGVFSFPVPPKLPIVPKGSIDWAAVFAKHVTQAPAPAPPLEARLSTASDLLTGIVEVMIELGPMDPRLCPSLEVSSAPMRIMQPHEQLSDPRLDPYLVRGETLEARRETAQRLLSQDKVPPNAALLYRGPTVSDLELCVLRSHADVEAKFERQQTTLNIRDRSYSLTTASDKVPIACTSLSGWLCNFESNIGPVRLMDLTSAESKFWTPRELYPKPGFGLISNTFFDPRAGAGAGAGAGYRPGAGARAGAGAGAGARAGASSGSSSSLAAGAGAGPGSGPAAGNGTAVARRP